MYKFRGIPNISDSAVIKNKEISFNIYKRASEKPILRILKNLKPNYKNEKYLIKDKNGKVIQKSENLKLLIDRTSLGKIELIK